MLLTNLAILVLAGFAGFLTISKVPNTLHTPLMSGTNAIHGIVVLGGILVLGLGVDGFLNKFLLVIAIAFGTINVVGGFLVTDRMLEMFKSKPAPTRSRGGRRVSRTDLVQLLYIVAFALFIYGLMGLTGPRTAVRGNRIAAVGMAIAVIATLLIPGMGNWGLIALGVAIGTAVGIPAARQVKMTAMPQMVALFNGVGGGAVALIAWVEFRHSAGFADEPTYVAIFSLFAAIVGSVSFWGSNIAFAKLQELLPGRPITVGPGRTQQVINLALLLVAVACAVAITGGSDAEILMIVLLLAAALLGNFLVLPIGGADMPVVISLLNAFTGLSAAATGVALNNTALIVAGMIVGASGSILTNLMAQAMNRSIPSIVAGGFGGVITTGGTTEDGVERVVRSTSASDAAVQMAYRQPRGHRARLRDGRRPGPARGARADQAPGGQGHRGLLRHPSRRRAHARAHERAAGRGRRPLRPAQGDGPGQLRVRPHRREPRHRRQRRHQPRRAQQGGQPDLRDADPQRRRIGHR